jgi:uncharacterized membrane protein
VDLRRRRGLISIAMALPLLASWAVPAGAAQGLTLTTAFPAVTVSPGTKVSFDLKVDTSAPARINLALNGVPAAWSAELHGGGFVVDAVATDGKTPAEVRLDIDVPADATGTTRITVVASDSTSREELPLEIKVEAAAGGEVTMDTQIKDRRGPAGSTYTFSLSIHNDTEEDLVYTVTGTGPVGWNVTAEPTGQTQAASATVNAGAVASVTVTVKPPEDAVAGTYPVSAVATIGSQQLTQDLSVEITGSYGLSFPSSQLLSARGPAGGATEQTFSITNTGTAPVTAVAMTVTKPTGWEVTFDQETIDSIAAGETKDVKVTFKPAGDAIAGDYSLTLNARGKEASTDADIRFTVETSLLGAIIGGALILAAIGGLYWVFRRYGRR